MVVVEEEAAAAVAARLKLRQDPTPAASRTDPFVVPPRPAIAPHPAGQIAEAIAQARPIAKDLDAQAETRRLKEDELTALRYVAGLGTTPPGEIDAKIAAEVDRESRVGLYIVRHAAREAARREYRSSLYDQIEGASSIRDEDGRLVPTENIEQILSRADRSTREMYPFVMSLPDGETAYLEERLKIDRQFAADFSNSVRANREAEVTRHLQNRIASVVNYSLDFPELPAEDFRSQLASVLDEAKGAQIQNLAPRAMAAIAASLYSARDPRLALAIMEEMRGRTFPGVDVPLDVDPQHAKDFTQVQETILRRIQHEELARSRAAELDLEEAVSMAREAIVPMLLEAQASGSGFDNVMAQIDRDLADRSHHSPLEADAISDWVHKKVDGIRNASDDRSALTLSELLRSSMRGVPREQLAILVDQAADAGNLTLDGYSKALSSIVSTDRAKAALASSGIVYDPLLGGFDWRALSSLLESEIPGDSSAARAEKAYVRASLHGEIQQAAQSFMERALKAPSPAQAELAVEQAVAAKATEIAQSIKARVAGVRSKSASLRSRVSSRLAEGDPIADILSEPEASGLLDDSTVASMVSEANRASPLARAHRDDWLRSLRDGVLDVTGQSLQPAGSRLPEITNEELAFLYDEWRRAYVTRGVDSLVGRWDIGRDISKEIVSLWKVEYNRRNASARAAREAKEKAKKK